MKQTVYLSDFRDAFRSMGRSEQFTYEGLEVLFDYLTEIEDCDGQEIELDVIALCCEFAEDTPKSIAEGYNIDLPDIYAMTEDEATEAVFEAVKEHLWDEGVLIGCTDTTIVYRQF